MNKNKKFIFAFLIIVFSFLIIYFYLKKSFYPVEKKIEKRIESKFESIEKRIISKKIKNLGIENWSGDICEKWLGFTPKVNIKNLPEGELFYYENEIAGFFGYREGNKVFYYKIVDLDFFTQQKTSDFFLKNIIYKSVNIDYIKYNDYEYKKFLERKFEDSDEYIIEKNKRGEVFYLTLIRNLKGTPVILLKVKEIGKIEANNMFLKKIYPLFILFFLMIFFIYFFIFKNLDLKILVMLFLLLIFESIFFKFNFREFLFPVKSSLSLVPIIPIFIVIRNLLKKRYFYIIFVIYLSFFLFVLLEKEIPLTSFFINITIISITFLIFFINDYLKNNLKLIILFFLGISLVNYYVYELTIVKNQNIMLEKISSSITSYISLNIKITNKIVKNINTKAFNFFMKRYDESKIAGGIFDNYFLYRIKNRELPSIAVVAGDHVVSYFSLSNPLPQFPLKILKGNYKTWQHFTTETILKGIKLSVNLFIRDFKNENKKYKVIIFYPQNFYEDALFYLRKNGFRNIFLLKSSIYSPLKRIKRNGQYFVVRKENFLFRGIFFNIDSKQYFLSFPYRDIYFKTVDWLKINFFVITSILIFILFLKRERLGSLSFKINFLTIMLPMFIVLILELSLSNYFKNYQYLFKLKEWENHAMSVEKISNIFSNENFSPEEISYFIYKSTERAVAIYSKDRIEFFNGFLDRDFFYLPYSVYSAFKSGGNRIFIKKREKLVFFYRIKEKIFSIFFDLKREQNLAFILFTNHLIFYTLFFTILVLSFTQMLIKKYNRGVNRIIEGLNKVKEEKLEIIQDEDSGEIGELIVSFNKMVNNMKIQREKIKELTEKEALLKVARKVAHEIKNPLTPIKLNIEYLFNIRREDPEEFNRSFDKIMKSTKKEIETLERVVKDFLNFSRAGTPPLNKIDLLNFLERTILLFKGSGVKFSVKGDKIVAIANEAFLETAIKNIIINAIEALENEKKIDIEVLYNGDFAEIRIRDYGKGIKSDKIEDIFKSGFTTKKGSGLGLSIAKEMIEKMGGKIKIVSWEGEGTLVIIKLKREV